MSGQIPEDMIMHTYEKRHRPGRKLILPCLLLCMAALTGCAMTPRFTTAKELLARHRQIQERFAETGSEAEGATETSAAADDPENLTEKGAAGLETPESIPEGISEGADAAGSSMAAGSTGEENAAEANDQLSGTGRAEDALENPADAEKAPDGAGLSGAGAAAAEQEVYTSGAWYLIPGRKLTYAYPLTRPARSLYLLSYRLARMLETYEGTWSAAVRDLSSDEKVVINDVPMPSASIMKLFILGSLYEDIRLGLVERTEELVQRMKSMISASSNTDANEIIRILGQGDYAAGVAHINDYIFRSGYSENTRIYNPFQEESLILDAEHVNQTTAEDTAELLERIYRRTFANRRSCNEAEQMLLESTTRYKLPSALPDTVSVANKTGETDEIENDAILVFGSVYDYVLTVFSTDWTDKQQAQRRFKEISAEVFLYFSDEDYAGKYFPYYPERSEVSVNVMGDSRVEAVGQNMEG